MRKTLLGFAALLVLVSAKALSAQTELITNYDTHIDKGGIVHCLNEGNKCTSW